MTDRFSVLPLMEKGDSYLCVDANFNFLLLKKNTVEEYLALAIPQLFDTTENSEVIQQAKQYLPTDPKKLRQLILHLKQKGPNGFEDVLNKSMEG